LNDFPVRDQSEIVIYQPDENLQLQVRLENETVWLNRRQLAELFGRDIKTIGKHINNALREELSTVANFATVQNGIPVVANFATTASDGKVYQMEYYSLDMILSIGYRVKSNKGILFRRWANMVLKNYLLNGYAFNQRFERLEHRVANVEERQNAFDIEIHAALPPTKGVFYEGQVFDARQMVEKLLHQAKHEIILIDNYVNADVLALLNESATDVKLAIYTTAVSDALQQAAQLNKKQNNRDITLKQYGNKIHDRFLIIDDDLYHFGASIKDLGKKLFAFSKLNLDKMVILEQLNNE
jgi:hypothetical protein